MNRLASYIFLQCAGPLVFFTLIFAGILWLATSLQMLDLVINRGQSAATFIELNALAFPALLADVLPISLFCSVLYTLHHLKSDSEIIVMWASGHSHWSIARPILMLAALVFVLNLFLNLYLMPTGYRAMKDRVYEIRSDLVTQLVKEGTFTNPTKGLTVYIRKATNRGRLEGLLIHDHRDTERTTTYMAETGFLMTINASPQLIMEQGNIQTIDNPGRPPILTAFERYTLDLSPFMKEKKAPRREFRERYLGELFRPDLEGEWDVKNYYRLRAEGHNRLAAPLYNFAFVMIAIVCIIGGPFGRRGMAWRITGAMAAVFVVRTVGFAGQSASTSSIALTFLQYLMPIGAVLFASAMLSGFSPFRPQHNEKVPDFLASD
jgi:lipopolysaccharide export system permease protein